MLESWGITQSGEKFLFGSELIRIHLLSALVDSTKSTLHNLVIILIEVN